MHELSITQELLTVALQHAREAGANRITRVRVKVGEFTAVDPACLEYYFTGISEGTIADGAELAVDKVPLAARCSDCETPFVPEDFSFRCPACRSAQVRITSGRELFVESIEVI